MKNDVVFFSVDDWANVGGMLAAACRSIGMNAHSFVQRQHDFGYAVKSEVWKNREQLQEVAGDSRAIVHMHSHFFDVKVNKGSQQIAVFHGGTRFRNNPESFAKKYNPRVHTTFIQTGDLFGFGCKNERMLIPPVDTEYLLPRIRSWQHMAGGVIFGHYPRATGDGAFARGTDKIVELMKPLTQSGHCRFWVDTKTVTWEQNIGRVGNVDVYIERLSPVVQEWGVTALEAAAMGKVVITNSHSMELYESFFGECPFLIANTEDELRKKVELCLHMPAPELHAIAVATRKWVEEKHSLNPTGFYLQKELEL